MSLAVRIARAALFALSALGLLVSIVVYGASFGGKHLDDLPRAFILLHVGVFVTYVPLALIEQRVMRHGIYAIYPERYRLFIRRTSYALFGFFVVHFVLLLVLTGAKSPQVENGQYVLTNHGKDTTVISKGKYDSLKELELRLFATGWSVFYFVGAAYWFFPRQQYLILPIDERAPDQQ